MKAKKLVLATLAVSAFAIGGATLAQGSFPGNGNPMPMSLRMAVKHAKISMPTAILKAEKVTGGKAVEAKLFSEAGGPVYLIACQDPAGPGVIGVKVDAQSGHVFGEPEKMHIEDAGQSVGE